MAMPTMFGFFIQTLYDIVDIIWIGRISSEAVAGVTIFSAIFWMVEILNEIIDKASINLKDGPAKDKLMARKPK